MAVPFQLVRFLILDLRPRANWKSDILSEQLFFQL